MIPADFNESNTVIGPPPDMTESQVEPIRAFVGEVAKGSCEGARLVVVAWAPSAEERAAIEAGSLVYLSMIGGLLPHFITTDFANATNPR